MKRFIYAVCMLSVMNSPLYAEDLCIEQAKAMGYVGAHEMLPPCKADPSAAAQELRIEREEKKQNNQAGKSQSQPIAQTVRRAPESQ